MHSSILGNGFKSRIVPTLRYPSSAQNLKVPSFFALKTAKDTHSVRACCITIMTSMFANLHLWKLRACGPPQYGAECVGRVLADTASTLCLTATIHPRCSSCFICNAVRMLINFSVRWLYSSGIKSICTSSSASSSE